MAFKQIASSATGTVDLTSRGRGKSPAQTLGKMIDGSGPVERGLPRQQAVERGPKAVHIACGAQLGEPARCLFRAHVARRAHRRACPGIRSATGRDWRERDPIRCGLHIDGSRLGQSPVDHQRLAILVQNDVRRFQVAVEDSATVRVSHRVTHIHEPCRAAGAVPASDRRRRCLEPWPHGTWRSHL